MMISFAVDQPNFPRGLGISPSVAPANTGSPKGEMNADHSRYSQDIDGFGIAGRIWEAAYLLPTYWSASLKSIEFDPPNPFGVKWRGPYTVVELGSGTGYVGLELAKTLGTKDTVILTDLEEVCPLLKLNTEASVGGRATEIAEVLVKSLPWGSTRDCQSLLSDLETKGKKLSHVVCSDLVYFSPLFEPLLRTLLQLTAQSEDANTLTKSVSVIISYQIRCLEFETPFWRTFGAWFDFKPVWFRSKPTVGEIEGSNLEGEPEWQRLGSSSDAERYVFVALRRPESLRWPIPETDDELMNGRGDDTFESLLQLNLSV